MVGFDEASGRLVDRATRLAEALEGSLAEVRRALAAGRPAAAAEFEGFLRRLDDLNEAAGDCLAAIEAPPR